METTDTVVIGAGAAGMMAALQARAAGSQVVVLEAGQRPGRKILISGNGRCNLLNIDGDDPSHYHGTQARFVRPALRAYPVSDTVAFFEQLGIRTKQEKRGRLFPQSDQARSVVDLLVDRMTTTGVRLRCEAAATALTQREDGQFVVQAADGSTWAAQQVIMSSGGVSLPKLGADDSGMRLAESLGHQRTALYPGLVAMESADPWVRRMQGVRVWSRVQAQLVNATVVDTDDLLFTKYGVSGFTILNLSARVVKHLRESGPIDLTVSVVPDHSAEEVSDLLRQRWADFPERGLALSLAGWLHDKVANALLDKAGLSAQMASGSVSKGKRRELAQLMTGWPITVTGPREFDYAEVTIGGIRTDEIDPHSLQSYVAPGLFFAGEMVDVHGDLGGFNFQWAWSSGTVAGRQTSAR